MYTAVLFYRYARLDAGDDEKQGSRETGGEASCGTAGGTGDQETLPSGSGTGGGTGLGCSTSGGKKPLSPAVEALVEAVRERGSALGLAGRVLLAGGNEGNGLCAG